MLFLATLQNGLSVSGVQSYWQQIITGAILIAVVTFDRAHREGLRSMGLSLGARGARRPAPTDDAAP